MDFRRAVCVDGPLAGAQVTFREGETRVVLHGPDGADADYELGELLGPLPGSVYAARYVTRTTGQ